MKIIEAVWEKRNIGVECREFNVEDGDALADVTDALASRAAQYMVVKVPAARTDVMFALAAKGYAFIECAIHAVHNLVDVRLNKIERRLAGAVEYAAMDGRDVEFMYHNIRKGIFRTDRISLDPYFTPEQAANRYVRWIADEISRGSECYNLLYKGGRVGFFTLKDLGEGVYYPFLSGIYDDSPVCGFGFIMSYKPICEIIKRNGVLLSTYLSSNNQNALNVSLSMGFSLKKMSYVYVRHNDLSDARN